MYLPVFGRCVQAAVCTGLDPDDDVMTVAFTDTAMEQPDTIAETKKHDLIWRSDAMITKLARFIICNLVSPWLRSPSI